MRELSLYFHVPYCKSKCHYCDFASYPNKLGTVQEYFECMIKEIDLYAWLHGSCVGSIFFGGGTPSLVEAEFIKSVLDKCRETFNFNENIEITTEANPESLTWEKLKQYREMGINRLSIGLQAWQDRLLKRIGRVHTFEQFVEAFTNARNAGFDNISVDLMFSLPEQSLQDWEETLQNVVVLNPEHISCYSLKLEEGTRLCREYDENKFELPDDETDREMYYMAQRILKANGYNQYEISNFAKPSRESRHNLTYWTFGEYLGLGAAAHSFYEGQRAANVAGIEDYISKINEGLFAYESKEALSKKDQMSEFIITGLRLIKGVSKTEFIEKFGIEINKAYPGIVGRFVNEGLMLEDGEHIRLTRKGLDLSNVVMREFV